MAERKDDLIQIVGAENIIDDPEKLESYSKDQSFTPARKPHLVVKPKTADEIHKVVVWANQTRTPLVPVSSGVPHSHGGTVPAAVGAVIVDMSGMKAILKIDRRNRFATFEPGVTFNQLLPKLAKEGMTISTPLLPRAGKSVMASLLEREPTIVPRYQYSLLEPLRAFTVVWGNGEKFNTGSAASSLNPPLVVYGPGQADWCRFIVGAQGTMGIVTVASVRCKALANPHKIFFVPSEDVESLLPLAYKLLKLRYGDELMILNSFNLASILAEEAGQVEALKKELPGWVMVIGIAGRFRLPEERVKYQEMDIAGFAQDFGLKLLPALPAVTHGRALEALLNHSGKSLWKAGYKGASQELFFLTTLDKTPGFVKTMFSAASRQGYSTAELGVYIQPQHQGVSCHCEFDLPYNPADAKDTAGVRSLLDKASEELSKQGAYFSRPYGIWSELAFARDAMSTEVIRKMKHLFDPNNVMNPGKLCF